jgi:iron complex outermembrane receptor protein
LVDSPYAYDPGGLTLKEVQEDRKQARERNIEYQTKEDITHYKLNSSFNKKLIKSFRFQVMCLFQKEILMEKFLLKMEELLI